MHAEGKTAGRWGPFTLAFFCFSRRCDDTGGVGNPTHTYGGGQHFTFTFLWAVVYRMTRT